MNYLIYLGIFILGAMSCVVIMSLLYLGNEGSSIEGRIRENCDLNKLDKKFLSNDKQTLSAFPPVKDSDEDVLYVSFIILNGKNQTQNEAGRVSQVSC